MAVLVAWNGLGALRGVKWQPKALDECGMREVGWSMGGLDWEGER